jgi:regulator of ribonuclease activity B
VDFKPIAIGTQFTIPIAGARVMGQVHAAGGGRVFCLTVGPPLCEGWQPAYESFWVVEDIALRDGSWRVSEQLRDFEPEPLRRFAAASKDDELVLAVYDPQTLHVTDTVSVCTAEQREEWERAPHFLPTDVATFEHALANTMQLPAPPLEPHPYDAAADKDRIVLAMLRERASDLSKALTFDHVLRVKDKRAARRAAEQAQFEGHAVKLETPFFGAATLEIAVESVPEYPLVRRDIHRFRALAERFGAEYDGFGALAR